MRSLGYFFKESLHGFTRNLSTTLGSIVTIFLSLLIIGIFLVGGVVVNNVMSSVENEVGISAFISDDASQSDIDKVEDFIRGIDGVASVDFTTKDQALENFKATSNSDIVDALDGQNPLPASIEVELSDPKLVEDVASQIEQNSTFASICGYDSPSESLKYGQKSVAQLFQLTSYVRYIGIALIVLLIFIALVFINNTIRLAILARRKEIAIMRLVGRVERLHPRALPHGRLFARHYRLAVRGRRARAFAQPGPSEARGRAQVPRDRRERRHFRDHLRCARDRGPDHRPVRLGARDASLPQGVESANEIDSHGEAR